MVLISTAMFGNHYKGNKDENKFSIYSVLYVI